jgi:cysteine-rich repeat protein
VIMFLMKITMEILAKLRAVALLLSFTCLVDCRPALSLDSCDNVDMSSKKINYFLVASQAMYAGDVLNAAFKWDHEAAGEIITEVLSRRDEKNGKPLPANRQPIVSFNQIYYNPLDTLEQIATRICADFPVIAPDPERNDEYIFITSMFGGAVVQKLLNGCLSTRLPAYDSEGNSFSTTLPTGVEIKFNRQVRSYIVFPDLLRGYRAPDSTIWPFYEFGFLKHFGENSQTLDGVKHLALGSEPLRVLNIQLDNPSVLALTGNQEFSRYPWSFYHDDNYVLELPEEWVDFRERVVMMFAGGTVYTCAPDWCEQYPGDVFCKCKFLSREHIGSDCRGEPACIYLFTHPECMGPIGLPTLGIPSSVIPVAGLVLSTEYQMVRTALRLRGYSKGALLTLRKLPTRKFCGDGTTDKSLKEECDDGNKVDGDGCSSTCKIEGVCGDGKVNHPNEECDSSDPTKPGGSCESMLNIAKRALGPEASNLAVRCSPLCKCEMYSLPTEPQ